MSHISYIYVITCQGSDYGAICYLEDLLVIFPWRKLKRSVPTIVESPCPADIEADARGLVEHIIDLLPGLMVHGKHHQPVSVEPTHIERLPVQCELGASFLNHRPLLMITTCLTIIHCMGPDKIQNKPKNYFYFFRESHAWKICDMDVLVRFVSLCLIIIGHKASNCNCRDYS